MRQRLSYTKSQFELSRLPFQRENIHSLSKKCQRYFGTLSIQFTSAKNDHATIGYDLATVASFCQLTEM